MTDSSGSGPNPDVVALTDSYCNGVLDDAGLARLEQLLLQDVAARAYFRRYMGLDAALREHGASDAEKWELPSPAKSNPAGRSSLWLRGLQIAGLAMVLAVAALLLAPYWKTARATAIGTLEQVTGDVRLLGADGQARSIAANVSLAQGDTVRTLGSESSTVVAYPDGTRFTLVGNTSVTCGDRGSNSLVVHQGILAASVQRQPTKRPLVLTTPSAQLQVLGTRFQIEALANRTNLSVTEGLVRLVRLRDQQSIDVSDGKQATVTEQNKLLVTDIPELPATWDEDFEAGLPEGWDRGEYVTSDLPAGSRGGIRATLGEVEGSDAMNYCISSPEAWLQGLFVVEENSHLHVTFKTEARGWINIFVVTRTAGHEDARYSGNYLLQDFPKSGSGQWETVTIPLKDFERIHAGSETLRDVVPFKLIFAFEGADRGLVIDRVWVTPDGPGKVVSKVIGGNDQE